MVRKVTEFQVGNETFFHIQVNDRIVAMGELEITQLIIQDIHDHMPDKIQAFVNDNDKLLNLFGGVH